MRAELPLLSAVLDRIPVAITVFDAEGYLLAANKEAARVIGRSHVDLHWLAWMDQEWELRERDGTPVPTPDWPVRRILRGESVRDWELVSTQKATGTSWIVSFSGEPIQDAAGKQTYGILVTRDITLQRRAEEALLQREREATEGVVRRDEFLGVLSHELRNPLAPIRNSVDLLQREASTGERQRALLQVLDRQVRQLTRLTDDLLDVTRISRGKMRLRCTPIDLAALVQGIGDDHRLLFEKKRVLLTVETPPEPIAVNADAVRIRQAVGNLLQNAAKFTLRDGRVSLRAVQVDSVAEVIVSDNGIGIDPDILPSIFEPFSQAPEPTDRAFGGLGLGLALAKAVVGYHGGSITAESPGPGQGATFRIALPTIPAASLPAAETRPAEHVVTSRRVLVVEDNEDSAEILRQLLEAEGHVVTVANEGRQALRLAREAQPQVVLCDLGLPGLDGFDVARGIRSDPALTDVWLVALSGYALPEDLRRSKEAGFDVHIPKPAPLHTLREAVAGQCPREAL